MVESGRQPLKLRFGGSLVEQLGAQLYPSATATIAELISNAWDADAENVWITIPLEGSWSEDSRIVVIDDGAGMTYDEAQSAYLIVGRKKRLFEGMRSRKGRNFHGRKGIGKLAAFGTAGKLECVTLKDDQQTAFALDYDEIRKLHPDEDYEVEPVSDASPPANPLTGDLLQHGTRIILSRLKFRRAIGGTEFMRSMARRFAIDSTQMRVWINEAPLTRFDIPLEFRFPRDGVPDGDITIDDGGWAVEQLPSGQMVRWWVGFTPLPIDDDKAIGVSVLAHDKMAQRPFEFERTRGLEGQLGLEYLVGEVKADWLDEGTDIQDDFIQSNRDQLQVEDARLDDFMKWGQKLIQWAVRKRQALRTEKNIKEFETTPELDELLSDYTKGEKSRLLSIARKASAWPEMNGPEVYSFVRDIVNSKEDKYVRGLLEAIEGTDESMQPQIWALVHEFGLIDARRTLSLVEARLATIAKLRQTLSHGGKEVPTIHNIIRDDPWLIDPRWSLLDEEVDISSFGIDFRPETDAETGLQLDYLFVLRPSDPATVDEVVVVEIKRASTKSGQMRKADLDEVNKFHSYVLSVRDAYGANTNPPSIRGLMICDGYTAQADRTKKSLEQVRDLRLEFKTWERVIQDTEKLHLAWLHISQRRSRPQ